MRTAAAVAGMLVLPALGYLAFWPVPVAPIAWQAPVDAGYVDPYAANDRLADAAPLELDGATGPEDAALGADGNLYVSTLGGDVLRLRVRGGGQATYARTGGRPLGIEFDAQGQLWVANALRGLQRIDVSGQVHDELQEAGNVAIGYANDVAVAADGRIYLSDSTTRFSPARYGGTFAAGELDILEHGGTGRIVEYVPGSGRARVVAAGLNFPNGVAVSADQHYLVVAETGEYRIWRYPRTASGLGERALVLGNLPGFPDNLNNGLNDRIWVGLVAPRVRLLDDWSNRPFLRRAAARLPAFLRPTAAPSSHVVGFTPDGQVLMNLQDTAAHIPALTGVVETRDALYLTSLYGSRLGRLDKEALSRH